MNDLTRRRYSGFFMVHLLAFSLYIKKVDVGGK